MKLIKTGLVIAMTAFFIACGGGNKQSTDKDTTEKTDSIAEDSNKLAAGTYENDRIGYRITYPKDVLVLQPETENTDEQVFVHEGGNAKLRIYVDERKDKSGKVLAFNEAFERDRGTSSKRQVSYSSLRPLFYVISGVEDGKDIFYQKTIMAKGKMVTAKLTYTKEEKPTFDAMIAPLFDSFN